MRHGHALHIVLSGLVVFEQRPPRAGIEFILYVTCEVLHGFQQFLDQPFITDCDNWAGFVCATPACDDHE